MDTQLIEHLKEYLSNNDIDGLLLNTTNDYMVEYNTQDLNSVYYTTEFTGSTGFVLFTKDKTFLFVDTRYHEQADNQVNAEFVDVVKVPLGKPFLSVISETIPAYFKLGVVGKKISKQFYEKLEKNLIAKNSTIRIFATDAVIEYKKDLIKNRDYNVFSVPVEITKDTADEKFETLKSYIDGNFKVIVTALEDIAYLTNLRSYSFDYSAIFPAKAIITQDGVSIYSNCDLPHIGKYFKVLPAENFEKDLFATKNEELFIDEAQLSIYDFNLINSNNKLKQSHLKLLKTVKNENEIEHLKKCFERSDKALEIIYKMLESDKIYSEYEYYQALAKSMKDNGAKSLSFKPIVASGENSSIIHYSTPSKEKMVNEGDFLLIDFGGYYEGGYATDTTRTFVKGEPTEEQKLAYTTVLRAYLNACHSKYSKKSTYMDIDKNARNTIEKGISEEYKFAHATGHGVGIGVHENPPVVSSTDLSKSKILENTVFSIEPGVYKEGWGGIRLENTVYASIVDDELEIISLSKAPFEMKLVDLSLLSDVEKYYYMKCMKGQAESCIH